MDGNKSLELKGGWRALRTSVAMATLAIAFPVLGGQAFAEKMECPAEIVFGVIAPVTGSKAEQGKQLTEGAKVAVDEINAAGGINGSKIRLDVLDDQGLPNEAVASAQRLASDSGVFAVIGPSSTASSSAAIPVLERAKIVGISPSASTASLVTGSKYFYIMSLPASSYGPLVPKLAVDSFGARSLATMYVKDDWGEGVTKITEKWAESNNIPMVGEASYTQGDRDFKSQLTALLANSPDALILNTHYAEGAFITRQARDLGYKGAIIAQGTNVYNQFIELAGDAAEGVVGWTDFLANLDTDQVVKAVQKFKDATGREPQQYHISSYDAVMVLRRALDEVGCDRDQLSTVVGQTKDFPGLIGTFGFDADRLPEKNIFWTEVKDGKWSLRTGG